MGKRTFPRLFATMAVAGLVLAACAGSGLGRFVGLETNDRIPEREISALASMETASGTGIDHPAARHIAKLGDTVIARLTDTSLSENARIAYFERLLARDLDIPMIARFVLGAHWRKATLEQRRAYVEVFERFLLNTYSSRLGGIRVDRLQVTGIKKIGGSDVLIKSKVFQGVGRPAHADWRLRERDGRFLILDLAVEGIRMAMMLRQEFASVLRAKGGVNGLISTLRRRSL